MKENELTPFTFPDTGIPILIKKVSPLLIMELRKLYPEPKPPAQEVEINGKKVIEYNMAHPEYIEAMQAYQLEFEQAMRKVLIRRGVSVTMTEDVKEAVKQIKKDFKQDTGHDLSGTDEYIYVSYIGIGTDQDMEDLIREITQRSQPTPGSTEVAKKSFPS